MLGETAFMSTNAAYLSHVLFLAGRHDEAGGWANRAIEVGDPHDRVTHVVARMVLAMLAAARGEPSASQSAREALALAAPMQAPQALGEAALNASAVFQMLGDREAEGEQLQRALEYFTAKGSTAYVEFTNALLEDFAGRG